MKYESCTLKTSPVILSEPKCWQSSVVTLTFDLLTPKCKGIFLSPSYIYVWNMKAVRWKIVKLSCRNQSVDRQTKGLTDRQTDKPDSYRAPCGIYKCHCILMSHPHTSQAIWLWCHNARLWHVGRFHGTCMSVWISICGLITVLGV